MQPELNKIYQGDNRITLRGWPDDFVDSVVTDPPYELGFMGKKWDSTGIAYDVGMWREVLRVMKPGAHLLAFSGTRTYHRMVCAIEDAGFEIRDQIQWLYGSGFPKSLNISKAIDRENGDERPVVGESNRGVGNTAASIHKAEGLAASREKTFKLTSAASAASAAWDGWGTALKPANEPIVLARKPCSEPTIAANVLKWGTGAMNIEKGRIGDLGGTAKVPSNDKSKTSSVGGYLNAKAGQPIDAGRWPANILFDQYAAGFLDAKEADASRFFYVAKPDGGERNQGLEEEITWESVDLSREQMELSRLAKDTSDAITRLLSGSAWNTISSGSENEGLSPSDIKSIIETVSNLTTASRTWNSSRQENINGNTRDAIGILTGNGLSLAASAESISRLRASITDAKTASTLGAVGAVLKTLSEIKERGRSGNTHSTVKPVDLMSYLIQLITPPNGIVLDPFMGSGTTGIAAARLGFPFLGCELSPEYVAISEKRIAPEKAQGKLL